MFNEYHEYQTTNSATKSAILLHQMHNPDSPPRNATHLFQAFSAQVCDCCSSNINTQSRRSVTADPQREQNLIISCRVRIACSISDPQSPGNCWRTLTVAPVLQQWEAPVKTPLSVYLSWLKSIKREGENRFSLVSTETAGTAVAVKNLTGSLLRLKYRLLFWKIQFTFVRFLSC